MILTSIALRILPATEQVSNASCPRTQPCNGNPLPILVCPSARPQSTVMEWALDIIKAIREQGFTSELNPPTTECYQYPVFVDAPIKIASASLGAIMFGSNQRLSVSSVSVGARGLIEVQVKGNIDYSIRAYSNNLPVDHHTDGEQEEYVPGTPI